MSRNVVELLSDDDEDEDDDLLLGSAASIFSSTENKKISPQASYDSIVLTPLGTASFPLSSHVPLGQPEEAVRLELTREGAGSHSENSVLVWIGNKVVGRLPKKGLGSVLAQMPHVDCQASRSETFTLEVNFSAKASHKLAGLEREPFVRNLQRHLGPGVFRPMNQNVLRVKTTELGIGLSTTTATVTPDHATASANSPAGDGSSGSLAFVSPMNTATTAAAMTPHATPSASTSASAAMRQPAMAAASAASASSSTIRVNSSTGLPFTVAQEITVQSILAARDLYQVLRITRGSNLAAVKKAYRQLARLVHPDKNHTPNAAASFQRLAQAYSTLSDPHHRATYEADQVNSKPSAQAWSPSDPSYADVDAEDLFRSFFHEQDDEMETIHVEIREPDWENQHQALETMFDDVLAKQLADLPAFDMPPQLRHLKLFPYQIEGIQWLVNQERSNGVPSWFQQEGPRIWLDKITGSTYHFKPKPSRGGILADDMGLGKTLQTIGAILANPPEGQTGYPYRPRGRGSPPRCTLILAPLSVMANWTMQIRKHVNQRGRKEVLKVASYHGPNRHQMVPMIENNCYDIVLTSYHTLAYDYRIYAEQKDGKECKKKAKVTQEKRLFLFDLLLHRIILDEAHIIRNSKTGLFKAVKQLSAKYKLCLTGTPFVNRPDDIHSLLSFLGVLPLAQKKVFKQFVTEKIKARKETGMQVLRTAMAYISLRRRKETVSSAIQLVPRTVEVHVVEFSDGPQKELHYALYNSARAVLDKMLELGGDDFVIENYMHFIVLILRVRQSSCHASLVPRENYDAAMEILERLRGQANKDMNVEEAEDLLQRLRGAFVEGVEKLEECAVCFEPLEEESAVVLRTCKHIFCAPCLNNIRNSCCPMCRVSYTPDDMVQKAAVQKAVQNNKKKIVRVKQDTVGQSCKLNALFELIDQMKPDEKAVIFSQWTSLLNIVQGEMQLRGHTFTRIDGSMNPQERVDSMEKFDTVRCDSMRTPRFILCSLHACGTGINLERGNVCFMLDPWWNIAAETQAWNRIHRISSTRPVRVYRMVMADSLEQRMLGVQKAKEMLGKGIMERLSQAEKRKARITALRDLFELPENLEQDWEAY